MFIFPNYILVLLEFVIQLTLKSTTSVLANMKMGTIMSADMVQAVSATTLAMNVVLHLAAVMGWHTLRMKQIQSNC